jgi:hypothetical protein
LLDCHVSGWFVDTCHLRTDETIRGELVNLITGVRF